MHGLFQQRWHDCPKRGSLCAPIANDVVDAWTACLYFFALGSCVFCTKKSTPKYFSEDGEKLFFDLQIISISA